MSMAERCKIWTISESVEWSSEVDIAKTHTKMMNRECNEAPVDV
jgi:hypothetical protein